MADNKTPQNGLEQFLPSKEEVSQATSEAQQVSKEALEGTNPLIAGGFAAAAFSRRISLGAWDAKRAAKRIAKITNPFIKDMEKEGKRALKIRDPVGAKMAAETDVMAKAAETGTTNVETLASSARGAFFTRGIGRAIPYVGVGVAVAASAWEINEASKTHNPKKMAAAVGDVGGSFAGAFAGAQIGVWAGAGIGAWFGGVGAVPGAFIGGIIGAGVGAVAGGYLGRKYFPGVYSALTGNPLNSPQQAPGAPKQQGASRDPAPGTSPGFDRTNVRQASYTPNGHAPDGSPQRAGNPSNGHSGSAQRSDPSARAQNGGTTRTASMTTAQNGSTQASGTTTQTRTASSSASSGIVTKDGSVVAPCDSSAYNAGTPSSEAWLHDGNLAPGLQEIHWGFNKGSLVDLDKTQRDTMDANIKIIKAQGGDAKIIITGHTDTVGSSSYNKGLGQDRAQSEADYYVQQGIDRNRIVVKSDGFEDPEHKTAAGVADQTNRSTTTEIDKGASATLATPKTQAATTTPPPPPPGTPPGVPPQLAQQQTANSFAPMVPMEVVIGTYPVAYGYEFYHRHHHDHDHDHDRDDRGPSVDGLRGTRGNYGAIPRGVPEGLPENHGVGFFAGPVGQRGTVGGNVRLGGPSGGMRR